MFGFTIIRKERLLVKDMHAGFVNEDNKRLREANETLNFQLKLMINVNKSLEEKLNSKS